MITIKLKENFNLPINDKVIDATVSYNSTTKINEINCTQALNTSFSSTEFLKLSTSYWINFDLRWYTLIDTADIYITINSVKYYLYQLEDGVYVTTSSTDSKIDFEVGSDTADDYDFLISKITLTEKFYHEVTPMNQKDILLNKELKNYEDVSKFRVGSSYPFNLPLNDLNETLLNYISYGTTLNYFYDSIILEDGLPIFEGVMSVNKRFTNIDNVKYVECIVIEDINNFFNNLRDKKLDELNIEEDLDNITYSTANALQNATDDVNYTLVHNNRTVKNYNPDLVRNVSEKFNLISPNIGAHTLNSEEFFVGEFTPAVYVRHIWDSIHNDAGIEYTGDFFNAVDWKSLLVSDLSEYKYNEEELEERVIKVTRHDNYFTHKYDGINWFNDAIWNKEKLEFNQTNVTGATVTTYGLNPDYSAYRKVKVKFNLGAELYEGIPLTSATGIFVDTDVKFNVQLVWMNVNTNVVAPGELGKPITLISNTLRLNNDAEIAYSYATSVEKEYELEVFTYVPHDTSGFYELVLQVIRETDGEYTNLNPNVYTTKFPVSQSDTYVKSTSFYDLNYLAYNATTQNTLIGPAIGNTWQSGNLYNTNQRFHVDLGYGIILDRLYYENYMNYFLSVEDLTVGAKNFTIWGSNEYSDFDDLTYANDGTWVQLSTDVSYFEQHINANTADPKYVYLDYYTTPYRYYAIKIADNWGDTNTMGVRRFEFQYDIYPASVFKSYVSGINIEMEPIELIAPNDTKDIKTVLPDMKQIDFIKDLMNLFNLKYRVEDDKIHYYTTEEFYTSGSSLDITNSVSGLIEYKESSFFQPKQLELNYDNNVGSRIITNESSLSTIQKVDSKFSLRDTYGSTVDTNIYGLNKPIMNAPRIAMFDIDEYKEDYSYLLYQNNVNVTGFIMYNKLWNIDYYSTTFVTGLSIDEVTTSDDFFTLFNYNKEFNGLSTSSESILDKYGLVSNDFLTNPNQKKLKLKAKLDSTTFSELEINDIIRLDESSYILESVKGYNSKKLSEMNLIKFNFNNNFPYDVTDITFDYPWISLVPDSLQFIDVALVSGAFITDLQTVEVEYFDLDIGLPLIIENEGATTETEFSFGAGVFTSVYPTAQSDTYVKATSKFSTDYWPYYATDPLKSVTGSFVGNAWVSVNGTLIDQRFHIDLGTAQTIEQIYYENLHHIGNFSDRGAKEFTFWGSNTASDFADLVYANDGTWVQLTTDVSQFDQHVASDVADPKYVAVTNSTPYRYYAIKFANNWGGGSYMGVRRIELQTNNAIWFTVPTTHNITITSISDTFTLCTRLNTEESSINETYKIHQGDAYKYLDIRGTITRAINPTDETLEDVNSNTADTSETSGSLSTNFLL